MRGDPTGNGGQCCYVGDSVVIPGCFTSPRGVVCYHSFRLEVATIVVRVQHICHNHALGMNTVGVKVNVDNTEICVFP